jgi:hypothetical protein
MPGGASALILSTMIAAFLDACTPVVSARMSEPTEVMNTAWGPFARQCTSTRNWHNEAVGRSKPMEVTASYESCSGFAAMSVAGGAMEITVSTAIAQSSTPIISRMLRSPDGVTRPAASGDTGLLAQGSASPKVAEIFASQVGLTRRQVIDPKGTLLLPILLQIPSPVIGTLSCHPNGRSVEHDREIFVLTCASDEMISSDRVAARMRLGGVEAVDILTGVRLSGELHGSLIGRERFNPQSRWQPADYNIWYRRTTEFE